MIANFYHAVGVRHNKLIALKNLEVMPSKGDYVVLSGQIFQIQNVSLDLDSCEYNIYVCRS